MKSVERTFVTKGMRKAVGATVLATLAAVAAGAEPIWLVTMPASDGVQLQTIMTQVEINQSDLRKIRANHPGVPREEVVPCIAYGTGLFSGTQYFNLNDVASLRGTKGSGTRTLQIHTYSITLKDGRVFEQKPWQFGPFRICRAGGPQSEWARDFPRLSGVDAFGRELHLPVWDISAMKSIDADEANAFEDARAKARENRIAELTAEMEGMFDPREIQERKERIELIKSHPTAIRF